MQIFMDGHAEKDFAPDQIIASVIFEYRGETYNEALHGGVQVVKQYIDGIAELTNFKAEDFRTSAYSIREKYHINRIEPKTEEDLKKNLERRISDGYEFTQYAYLAFDYDKTRLAKLLAISSKIPNAPLLHIDFTLKDEKSKICELIPEAYADAKKKAEALAVAANKNLRDCVRVEIDPAPRSYRNGDLDGAAYSKSAKLGAAYGDIDQEIKAIDETFKPNDISLSKDISCVWETSN